MSCSEQATLGTAIAPFFHTGVSVCMSKRWFSMNRVIRISTRRS